MSALAEPPAEAAFFIGLYRREKAAAIARGAEVTHPHQHCNGRFRPGLPIGNVGDGNFHNIPLDPDRYLER